MTENFKSNFVFSLQGNRYQDFIEQIARPEIEKIIETDDYEIIGFENHLSFQDFKETDNIVSHIYTAFLKDIKKENGKVSFKKKVCITLDKRLCKDTCPNTGRKITTIKLAGVELAYFIYFDIKEFFNFAYDNDTQIQYPQEDTKINFKENIKPNNKLYNKTQNIEKVGESDVHTLDESIIQKLFSGTKNNDNDLDTFNYIEKIGYIHSKEIGFSRIRENPNDKTSFIIPHCKDFPKAKDLPIGTAIKAFGKFDSNGKFFVEQYEETEIDELPFQLITVNGTLFFYENSRFTLIKTNLGKVYAEFDLFKNYEPNIEHQVKCVIVESYNNKKDEMGWEAIWIGDNTALNQEYTQRFD